MLFFSIGNSVQMGIFLFLGGMMLRLSWFSFTILIFFVVCVPFVGSDCASEKDLLENLCSDIRGDAQLFSLFRLDATPEPCPFKGAPFNLTYNRGNGECKEPVSRVDSCTHNSTLLFRLQACPNVEKTESKIEELECLAHWREGSNHYLIGKLEGPMGNLNNEEKYKCFIWEKIKRIDSNGHSSYVGYQIAQSGYATCADVFGITDGARVLTLMKLEQGTPGECKFPPWVTVHHWHTLDGKISVKSHQNKHTTLLITEIGRKNSTILHGSYHPGSYQSGHRFGPLIFGEGSRLTCQTRVDISSHRTRITAYHMEGCKKEILCLDIFKREGHVIEIKLGKKSFRNSESEECPTHPSPTDDEQDDTFVTLISTSASSYRCPNSGKYIATGVSTDGRVVRESCGGNSMFNAVAVGCGERGTMEFHSKCATQEPIASYACHGSWREGTTGFLIASPLSRSSNIARRFCFIYTETEAGLQVSSSSESCRRNLSPGVDGNWAFNLTTEGPCAEKFTSGRGALLHPIPLLLPFLLVIITLPNFQISPNLLSSLTSSTRNSLHSNR